MNRQALRIRLFAAAGALLMVVAACGDDADDGGDVTVEQLEAGIDLTWSGAATDMTASVCWQRTDDVASGECPMALSRSGASSPVKVRLSDFDCPKCGAVAGDSLAGFLNESVAEGQNTKLIEWRVEWTAGSENNSRKLQSSDAVATPSGDLNPFGSG